MHQYVISNDNDEPGGGFIVWRASVNAYRNAYATYVEAYELMSHYCQCVCVYNTIITYLCCVSLNNSQGQCNPGFITDTLPNSTSFLFLFLFCFFFCSFSLLYSFPSLFFIIIIITYLYLFSYFSLFLSFFLFANCFLCYNFSIYLFFHFFLHFLLSFGIYKICLKNKINLKIFW